MVFKIIFIWIDYIGLLAFCGYGEFVILDNFMSLEIEADLRYIYLKNELEG